VSLVAWAALAAGSPAGVDGIKGLPAAAGSAIARFAAGAISGGSAGRAVERGRRRGPRVTQFGERLAEVAVRGRDAVAVVNAEAARQLMALNDAAEADGPRLSRQIGAELDAFLDGELRGAAPAQIERQGRERLVTLTLNAAETWRQQRRQLIEEGLAQVDARLTVELGNALDVLRESAAELLDLDLAVPEPGGRLAENRRFFYTTAEEVGQTELLAGAVRRELPGELGRRRVREHLRREAPNLMAAQIGRARGDLQYRLAEATRALARAVDQRYTDATGRMQAALRAAGEMRTSSAAAAEQRERELTEREAAVRHVLALLSQAENPAGYLPVTEGEN
jgi:hypothetical protein